VSKATPRLGKGLSALIGPRTAAGFRHAPAPAIEPLAAGLPDGMLREIPLDRIRPNPRQPRANFDHTTLEQLAASIRHSGVLQPVLVRRVEDGQFELIAGERRWRAAELAGLEAIPALVREPSDADAFEMALVENLQREDLGPLERATAYQQFIDMTGATADALAERLGESRASISNYLRLLKLDELVQQMISDGALAMGQARAIAALSIPQRQVALARLAARRNLSVRQVEALAKESFDVTPPATRPSPRRDSHLGELEEQLSKALGLSVKVRPGRKKNSGCIAIRYDSLEEFDRVAERISGRSSME
jgi:ParB family chromosome partitioning protein